MHGKQGPRRHRATRALLRAAVALVTPVALATSAQAAEFGRDGGERTLQEGCPDIIRMGVGPDSGWGRFQRLHVCLGRAGTQGG